MVNVWKQKKNPQLEWHFDSDKVNFDHDEQKKKWRITWIERILCSGQRVKSFSSQIVFST